MTPGRVGQIDEEILASRRTSMPGLFVRTTGSKTAFRRGQGPDLVLGAVGEPAPPVAHDAMRRADTDTATMWRI